MNTPVDSSTMSDPRTPQQKRKGDSGSVSPGDVPLIKRQNSLPDIRCGESKKGIPFTEMITQTLKQKSVLEDLAPVLSELLSPAIKSTMEAAIESFRDTVINPLLATNKELMETVKSQKDTIDRQTKELAAKGKRISNVEKELDNTKNICQTLHKDLNDLQQYGRRNSIRLNNFHPEGTPNEHELTNQVCLFLNTSVLKLDMSDDITDYDKRLMPEDIERCHPVGPKAGKKILIKFSRYHTKNRVLKMRRNLKNHPKKVFIVEDFTRYNHSIVLDLMHAKTHNRLHSFWTSDGKILVKLSEESRPHHVRTRVDVSDLVC